MMQNDEVENYLRNLFDEAAFDRVLDDGSMFCSDSNRSLNPYEITQRIRKMIAEGR